MPLYWFAQGNGHALPGQLPLAMFFSFAAHAALLLSHPLFSAVPMAPRSSFSTMHVELTSASPSAATSSTQRMPVSLSRTPAMSAHPPARSAEVHSAEPLHERGSRTSLALAPMLETHESDHAQRAGATSIAQAPPAARLAPAPLYPEEARWERRAGRVVLNFHIRLDGTVGDAQVFDSSGHADIDHAALTALRQWKFDAPSAVAVARYRYAFRFDLR